MSGASRDGTPEQRGSDLSGSSERTQRLVSMEPSSPGDPDFGPKSLGFCGDFAGLESVAGEGWQRRLARRGRKG